MYEKYYLVRTRGGHIRQVSLILGGLSSQGPLYMYKIANFELTFFFILNKRILVSVVVYDKYS